MHVGLMQGERLDGLIGVGLVPGLHEPEEEEAILRRLLLDLLGEGPEERGRLVFREGVGRGQHLLDGGGQRDSSPGEKSPAHI